MTELEQERPIEDPRRPEGEPGCIGPALVRVEVRWEDGEVSLGDASGHGEMCG